MYLIQIVEDDAVIAAAIEKHLTGWGYTARRVSDFREVLAEFVRMSPHLLLMDISLPFYNGYHWLGEIRKISKTPVIFISSAGDNMNIVMAMSAGADDFIAKPFDLNVLTAKIQAVLRRAYDFGGQMSVIEHRGVFLNVDDATLTYMDKRIELTKNEHRILRTLFENKNKIVGRDALMRRLWESDEFIDDNTLTVNMARLRRKLDEAGLAGLIITKKGIGYMVG